MRLILSTVCAVLFVGCAGADDDAAKTEVPVPASLAAFAGRWDMREFNETGDSIGTFQLVATFDTSGWMTVVPNRDGIHRRVVAFGGDSVVNEIGPFESVLRPGVQVSTREVFHVRGDSLFGTIIAHYSLSGPDSLKRILTSGTRAR